MYRLLCAVVDEPLSYFLFFVDEVEAIDLPTPMRLDAPSRVRFGANTKGELARCGLQSIGVSNSFEESCMYLVT